MKWPRKMKPVAPDNTPPPPPKFACEECGASYESEPGLISHLFVEHDIIPGEGTARGARVWKGLFEIALKRAGIDENGLHELMHVGEVSDDVNFVIRLPNGERRTR